MNEELAKSIYDSNGGATMFGDYKAFLDALNSNPKYVAHIYNKYGSQKFGSQSEFEGSLKKKEPTQPQSGSGSNQTQQSSGSQPSQGKSVMEQAAEIISGPKMSGTPQTPEQVAKSVEFAKSQQQKEPAKPKPTGPLNAPKASEPGQKVFSSETQLLDYMEELKANTSAESQAELKKIADDYAGIVSDINTNGSWSYESKAGEPGITLSGKVAQPTKPTFQTAKYQLDQINAGKLDPKTIDPNGRWDERNEYDPGKTYFDAAKGGNVTTQPGMKTKKVWIPSGEFGEKVAKEQKDYQEKQAAEMKAKTNQVERAFNQKNWDTYREVSKVDITTPEMDLMDLEEQRKKGQIDEQYYTTKKQELENRKKYSYKTLEATYLSALEKTDPDKHREYSERYSEIMNTLNKKGFETWEDANNFIIKNGKQNAIFEGDEDLEDLIGIDQSDTEFLNKLRREAIASSYAPIDRTTEYASDRQVRQYMTDIQPVINDVKQFSNDVDILRNSFSSGAITKEEYKARAEQLKLKEQELTTRAQQVQKETGVTDFDLNRYSKESEVQQNIMLNNENFAPLSAFEREKRKNIVDRQRWVTENPVLGGLVYGTGDAWRTFTDMVILETAKSVKPISEVLEVGDGYGWADRVYYGAETAQNNRDYLYGYSGMDIDGDGKADDLPEFAKLTQILGQGIGSVGAFALPGAVAGKVFSGAGKLATIGRFGVNTTGAFLMMEGQAYQEGLRAGLSQDDAAESATIIASLQAVAEQIVPDIKYFDNVATRAGLISSYKAGIRGNALLRQGLGKIDELVKNTAKGGAQEFGEEYFGALSTDLGKDLSNELYDRVSTFNMDGTQPKTYKDNPYQNLYQAKNLTDNGIAGFITGGGMRFFGGLRPMSQTQMQNLSYMGKNANDILRVIEQTQSNGVNPGDATFKEIEKQLTGISETWSALQSMPGFTELTTANQDAVMALTYRKNQIQENANKIGVTTDTVKKTLAQYDQEINDYLTGKKDYGATKPVMYNDDNLMAMGVRNVAVNPDGTYTIEPREDLNLNAAEVVKKAGEYIKTSLKDTAFADSFYHPKTDRNALQESSTKEVLPGQQGETPTTGGQPQGMGTGVQGQETTQEGGKKEVVSPTTKPTAATEEKTQDTNQKEISKVDEFYDAKGDGYLPQDEVILAAKSQAKKELEAEAEAEAKKKKTLFNRNPKVTAPTPQQILERANQIAQNIVKNSKSPSNTDEVLYSVHDLREGFSQKYGNTTDHGVKDDRKNWRDEKFFYQVKYNSKGQKYISVISPSTDEGNIEGTNRPSVATVMSFTLPDNVSPEKVGEAAIAKAKEIYENGKNSNTQVTSKMLIDGVLPVVKNEFTSAPEKAEPAKTETKKTEAPKTEATPTAETPTAEIKPTAGVRAVKPKVFDSVRKNALLAKFKGDSGKRALVSAIDRAANAIRQAYGNVPIYVHETTADMEAATAITGGKSMARTGAGTFQYDDKGNVIAVHVNMEKAGIDTAPHEFTHLILMDAFGDNPKLFKEFQDRILKALSASRVAELEAFVNQYTNKEVRPEEFLAQLAGLMTANQEKLTPTTAQKIMNLINEFISRLTKGKLIPFKANAQTKDLMDFFNTVSSAMSTGQGGEAIKAAAQKAGSKFKTAKKPTEEAGARDRSKEQNKEKTVKEILREELDDKDINSLRTSLRKKAPDSYVIQVLDEVQQLKKNENLVPSQSEVSDLLDNGVTLGNVINMLIEDGVFDSSKEAISYFTQIGGQESQGLFKRLSGVKSKEAIVGQVGVETAADDIAMQDLDVAKQMEAANRAAQDIKSATGWEVGADGQWRYEYPDVELNEDVKDDFDILFYLQQNAVREGVRVRPNEMYPPAPLSDILDFGKLEKAYPYISDITFAVNPNLGGATAVFKSDKNLIEFGPNAIKNKGLKDFSKTLTHEIQHYIQNREGFEFGSNLTEEADKFSKSQDVYKIPGLKLNGAKNVGQAVEIATKDILSMMDNGITITDIIEGNYDKTKYSGNPEAIVKHVADEGDAKSLDEMAATDLEGAKKIVENAINRNAIAGVAFQQYQSMAGEVEARNAEKRSEIPYAERLYGKTLESTEDVARRDQILDNAKKAVSAMDVISKKRGVSKAAEIKAQREILGENYDKAKQISDNFEDIAEKLGITKICGL